MNTLIVYASQKGSTADCAHYLKEQLTGEVTVVNVKEKIPKLDEFDTIIVGGSVHMMKIQRKIASFCSRYKKQLLEKKLGLFVCCYTTEGDAKFFDTFFDQRLLTHAKITSIFGGEMRYDKLNFAYRKLFQSLNKIEDFRKEFVEPEINYEEIARFAQAING
ncbi:MULTISPECIES: flavodoxin domain-containing protein [Enterococcus]|uniref:Flavodoxin domain-containing protein n=1 Tax=Candidatus Enterococcus murrayae TaxID=2815321 RepID=A0ABS3HMJ5_9ENTE|nr:flavodoxin domain-containing protein [Enterococcus sp. MJM16]MBO0454202.1 flavodoxin domain-containing protein [Enterococcus sp. MJM16]